jgi:hypothetical protein
MSIPSLEATCCTAAAAAAAAASGAQEIPHTS